MSLKDQRNRPLRDLRISLTDRCNFRCTYCMPREVFGPNFNFVPKERLLSFEEITRLTHLFAASGVQKIRLTGGEPLVRADVEKLIGMLRDVQGIQEIAMTTNGSLLTFDKAKALRDAGLTRITISLDSLDDETFRAINGVNFPVSQVLRGIDAALAAGFNPVKINMVVKRGMNEHSIVEMAKHFRGVNCILRFIEFMDVGNSNGWNLKDVVPASEIIRILREHWELEPVGANYPGEVAKRYRYKDGSGEIGMIASVTQPFCGACTRARITAEGKLFTCLFGSDGLDLRQILRTESTDEGLLAAIRRVWMHRDDHYSEIRSAATTFRKKIEMSSIGG